MENKTIYNCDKCSKKYKSKSSLEKHIVKCVDSSTSSSSKEESKPKENNYDVNMTFLKDNKVKVELKNKNDVNDATEEGVKVLREILKPDVSASYQEEIDKLEEMITIFSDYPIPKNAQDKEATIEQLKTIISIIMTQSKNLIKEMQEMSKRNSYYKNNIMLAAFVLDKCRRDVPENHEEFNNMFD